MKSGGHGGLTDEEKMQDILMRSLASSFREKNNFVLPQVSMVWPCDADFADLDGGVV
ncbi:hypothetical protein A2U01_0108943, partial [Trifolium medium]|nr:hypothetical protein [Trifolium medium]